MAKGDKRLLDGSGGEVCGTIILKELMVKGVPLKYNCKIILFSPKSGKIYDILNFPSDTPHNGKFKQSPAAIGDSSVGNHMIISF